MARRRFLFTIAGMVLGLAGVSPAAPSFSGVFVFGDSLSDTGNIPYLISVLSGYPTSEGRFTSSPVSDPPSDGRGVWHEVLAGRLSLAAASPSDSGGNNFAHGGAQTGDGTRNFGYTDNIGRQISNELARGVAHPNGLYAVWGGGNDLLGVADEASGTVSPTAFNGTAVAAVTNLRNGIGRLIQDDGATFIVWPNMVALERTPHAHALYTASVTNAVGNAVGAYNQAWSDAIAQIRARYPGVTVYPMDAHKLMNDLIDGSYAAWTGMNTTDIASEVPGATDADAYLFWQDIHPTQKAHQVFGEEAYQRTLGGAAYAGVATLAGDANHDAWVDDNDLSLLLSHWGATADWGHGDFNGDDTVNDNDLSVLLAHWTGSGAAVPEPNAAMLLGAVLTLRLRRRGSPTRPDGHRQPG